MIRYNDTLSLQYECPDQLGVPFGHYIRYSRDRISTVWMVCLSTVEKDSTILTLTLDPETKKVFYVCGLVISYVEE